MWSCSLGRRSHRDRLDSSVRGDQKAQGRWCQHRPVALTQSKIFRPLNADGHREILGLDVCSVEIPCRLAEVLPRPDRAWSVRGQPGHFRRPPRPGGRLRRDPCWCELATVPHPLRGEPDAGHPKSSWGWVKALLHSVYDQPDAGAVHAQFGRIVDPLADKLPQVAAHPRRRPSRHPRLHGLPKDLWRQIWSNNPNERLKRLRQVRRQAQRRLLEPTLLGARPRCRAAEIARGGGWSGCGRRGCARPVGGLKQFDEVACGVGEQDLAAARAGDHVAAERQSSAA
jgi:hypothetical protein